MAKTKKSAAREQPESTADLAAARPGQPGPAKKSGQRKKTVEPEEAGLSFEGALEQLEQTVGRLEEGEMPLEDALALFEQGVKLSRQCTTTLEAAEKRVEILVAGRGEGWLAAPFDSDFDSDVESDPGTDPGTEEADFD